MIRHCQICGCNLTTERKWCESCRKAKKREYAKQHYKDLTNEGIVNLYSLASNLSIFSIHIAIVGR